MDGDTGVQTPADFWKWAEGVCGEEFCDKRDQGERFSPSPRRAPMVFIVPSWLQVVLSVLVRHFSFELPDGPSTKLGTHRSLTVRPKVAGEEGAKVPLIVRRMEQ